ncbi:MAG: flagellar basal-body rod protein FlgB [Rhodocyclaceae bacterium]|nr:MAG: flagellar basal-body rod protein FlgB [Rhodocyclaceae bacterium]
MPTIDPIATPPSPQPPAAGGHGNHGAAPGATGNGGTGGLSLMRCRKRSGNPLPPGGMAAMAALRGEGRRMAATVGGYDAAKQRTASRASNIANADTPGYKAVDIDFGEALSIAQAAANTVPMKLAASAAGHLPGQPLGATPPIPLKCHVPNQASADGNTVEIDVERTKFSENTLMYQFRWIGSAAISR